jgi:Flp pilus assembly pilin Flp
MSKLYKWLKDKNAVTGIEYSFFAAFISLGIMAAVFTFGDAFYNMFSILTGFMSGNINN